MPWSATTVEDGRYVLYVGGVRGTATERVALLVDAERGRLVTHGDPLSVRREPRRAARDRSGAHRRLAASRGPAGARRAEPGPARDVDIHELHLAFTQASAQRLAGELIARLRQRRMT